MEVLVSGDVLIITDKYIFTHRVKYQNLGNNFIMFHIDFTNAFVIELSFIGTKSCRKPKTDARGNYVEKILFLHIYINYYPIL